MSIQEYIDKAINEHRDITIEYQKYDGTRSHRRLSNIEYSNEFGDGYISGFCYLRQENRTFKISRIISVDGISFCECSISNKTSYSTKTAYSISKPVNRIPENSRSNSINESLSNSNSTLYRNSPNILSDPASSSKIQSQSHKEGCYIATMAYGDYDHPQVVELRKFRDDYLLHHSWGRLMVTLYYWISPKLVTLLHGHILMNSIIRTILDAFISYVKSDRQSRKSND